MQPRQRSKCCGDRRVERDGSVEAGVHQVDATARRVHLLAPEDVRRARRQAEPAVDAVRGELANHAARTPLRIELSRESLEEARRADVSAPPLHRAVRTRRLTAGRTIPSRSGRASRRARPGRSARGRERLPAGARTRPRSRVCLRSRRREPAPLQAARRPRAPSLRRGRRRGRGGGRRARSAGAASEEARRRRWRRRRSR